MNNIITTVQLSDGKDIFLQNHMSDGSIWNCDLKGENWVKIIPNTKELQEKFNSNKNAQSNL